MIIVSSATVAAFNLGVSLVGTDGSVWDLVRGPVKLRSGFGGIGTPDPEHWWRDAPSLPGSYHLGQRDPRGDVLLPVKVSGETSGDWMSTQKAFTAAINTGGLCQLVITTPDGARSLNCRLVSGLNNPYEVDPVMVRSASYTLELAADYTYWLGALTTQTITGPTAAFVAAASTVVGDVPVWPKVTIGGPYTSVDVGLSTTSSPSSRFAQYALTATVTAAQSRIFQTDPRADVIAVTDNTGASAWSEVTARTFATITPGLFYISVTYSGAGSLSATMTLTYTPAYRQAW